MIGVDLGVAACLHLPEPEGDSEFIWKHCELRVKVLVLAQVAWSLRAQNYAGDGWPKHPQPYCSMGASSEVNLFAANSRVTQDLAVK